MKLRYVCDIVCQLPGAPVGGIPSIHEDLSIDRRDQAENGFKQCCFANTIWPQQAADFSGVDYTIYIS